MSAKPSTNLSAAALNVAMNVAVEAGKFITQQISKLDRIEVRERDGDSHRRNLVSDVDIQVEQMIIEGLELAYAEFSIQARESGEVQRDSEYSWIINPLNGTHNFLHGHPQCAVGIGLLHESMPVASVIYDPFRNELFSARKGGGAQLDGRRIRVSQNSRLRDSLFCTAVPNNSKESTKQWLKSYAQLLPRAQDIHQNSASLLDMAFVSAGRYDGYWNFDVSQWTAPIGSLIIQEAGGLTTHNNGIYVAGTPKLHEKLDFMIAGIK